MEKNNIKIINMTKDNLETIKDILETDFDNFWDISIIQDELESDNSIYIIAKINNDIVGFIGIKTILDEAEIMNIVTKKNCRHQGIASTMMEYIIGLCKTNNIKFINLEVNVRNTIAINFYKKYNFIEVGYRKKYYDKKDDALLMKLKI